MSEVEKKSDATRSWIYAGVFVLIAAIVMFIFPDKSGKMLESSWLSFKELLVIIPAIIILIGFFAVMITDKMVEKHLGDKSGFRGNVFALIFGSLMSTGPLYMAFPIAKNMLQKGSRISNIIIFVSAWDGLGLIAELVEFHFMGATFALLRIALTVTCVIIMGHIIEIICSKSK